VGAFTYLIWRFNKSWRKAVQAERELQAAAASSNGASA
jgi:hypothetical protein